MGKIIRNQVLDSIARKIEDEAYKEYKIKVIVNIRNFEKIAILKEIEYLKQDLFEFLLIQCELNKATLNPRNRDYILIKGIFYFIMMDVTSSTGVKSEVSLVRLHKEFFPEVTRTSPQYNIKRIKELITISDVKTMTILLKVKDFFIEGYHPLLRFTDETLKRITTWEDKQKKHDTNIRHTTSGLQ